MIYLFQDTFSDEYESRDNKFNVTFKNDILSKYKFSYKTVLFILEYRKPWI